MDLNTSQANQNNEIVTPIKNKDNLKKKNGNLLKKLNKGIQKYTAIVLITLVFIYILTKSSDNMRYDLILIEYPSLFRAFLTTIFISTITLLISIISGFVFFLGMKSSNQFIHTLTNVLREIIMGTPLLVMIFLVVYVLGIKIHVHNKIFLGILSLVLYMTPYIANAYDTASSVVNKDQHTVMNLYHFTTWQKYRYIIIPQMVRPIIPSMINNLSSIIKGSALLKIISVTEISYIIAVISNKSYAAIEGYLLMWIMYLCITIPLSLLANHLGRRYGYEN